MWPNFEKPLSQRNFSMKYWSTLEDMNIIYIAEMKFEKKNRFKMLASLGGRWGLFYFILFFLR